MSPALLLSRLMAESVTYTMPASPKATMADFYMLSWLATVNPEALVDAGVTSAFRIDLEDVRHAESVLYPALRQQFLSDVFFALCCEIRHLTDRKQGVQLSPFLSHVARNWLLYNHEAGLAPDKPAPRRAHAADAAGYRHAYDAVRAALRDTGTDRVAAVREMGAAFTALKWNASYGGKAWAGIAAGWLRLERAVRPRDLAVAIDHVYDLQHNTGTVFNKLQKYYDRGHGWIKQALDFKASLRNMRELLPSCSSMMRRMALPVLQAAGVTRLAPPVSPAPNAKAAPDPQAHLPLLPSGYVWKCSDLNVKLYRGKKHVATAFTHNAMWSATGAIPGGPVAWQGLGSYPPGPGVFQAIMGVFGLKGKVPPAPPSGYSWVSTSHHVQLHGPGGIVGKLTRPSADMAQWRVLKKVDGSWTDVGVYSTMAAAAAGLIAALDLQAPAAAASPGAPTPTQHSELFDAVAETVSGVGITLNDDGHFVLGDVPGYGMIHEEDTDDGGGHWMAALYHDGNDSPLYSEYMGSDDEAEAVVDTLLQKAYEADVFALNAPSHGFGKWVVGDNLWSVAHHHGAAEYSIDEQAWTVTWLEDGVGGGLDGVTFQHVVDAAAAIMKAAAKSAPQAPAAASGPTPAQLQKMQEVLQAAGSHVDKGGLGHYTAEGVPAYGFVKRDEDGTGEYEAVVILDGSYGKLHSDVFSDEDEAQDYVKDYLTAAKEAQIFLGHAAQLGFGEWELLDNQLVYVAPAGSDAVVGYSPNGLWQVVGDTAWSGKEFDSVAEAAAAVLKHAASKPAPAKDGVPEVKWTESMDDLWLGRMTRSIKANVHNGAELKLFIYWGGESELMPIPAPPSGDTLLDAAVAEAEWLMEQQYRVAQYVQWNSGWKPIAYTQGRSMKRTAGGRTAVVGVVDGKWTAKPWDDASSSPVSAASFAEAVDLAEAYLATGGLP